MIKIIIIIHEHITSCVVMHNTQDTCVYFMSRGQKKTTTTASKSGDIIVIMYTLEQCNKIF